MPRLRGLVSDFDVQVLGSGDPQLRVVAAELDCAVVQELGEGLGFGRRSMTVSRSVLA